MDRIERLLNSLIAALQRLAIDLSVDQSKGAKLAIWTIYSQIADEAEKKRFSEKLRNEAIDQEQKERPELEKLFWRDVAHYASAPDWP